jgi:3-oxoacyl-[acyl-carrier protein] reductase
MHLKGRTAIITGSGRGIGRATALDLAREGCQLVLTARSADELAAVKAEVERLGAQALALPLDLSQPDSPASLVERAVQTFGGIDILVNNAGFIQHNDILHATLEELDQTLAINLRAVFLLCQKALPYLCEKRSGYIINISSTAALNVGADLLTYGISKCGLDALSQSVYQTAKKFGVKVSTIYPGYTDTHMLRGLNVNTTPDQWMLPEDISNCILFLLKQSERVVIKDLVPLAVGAE